MKYTFREPYVLLKQYTSKQGFGNGHPVYDLYVARSCEPQSGYGYDRVLLYVPIKKSSNFTKSQVIY